MSEKRKYNETRVTAVICALLGMASFVAIYGVAVLDFTYVDWLLPVTYSNSDLTQHYLGWVTYRNSAWHFPLGLMDNVNYPHLISVIYMDALPLFSFIFKLLSPILPENFQFFGLFGFLCFALQGYFSGLLFFKCTKNRAYSVIGSLFLILSNIMIFRLYWHTGLAAHWIILASYAVWMNQEKFDKLWKKALVWSGLTIIGLLTEVYFVPMIWGIMICSLLQNCMKWKKYAESFGVLCSAVVSFVIVGWMFGLFYGGVTAGDYGLGLYSFNYNGFINTVRSDYHLFLKPLILTNDIQYEGYSYLGMGILVFIPALCVAAVVKYRKRLLLVLKKICRNRNVFWPVLILIVGFVGFAASPIISFGKHIFKLPISDGIFRIWSIFRSTGRMIWPIWYLIVFGVLVGWYMVMRKRKTLLYGVSVVLFVLQIIDFIPMIQLKKTVTQPGLKYQEECINSRAWEEIGENYKHMIFYPNTRSYMYWNDTPYYFHLYALQYDLTMNTTYFSRDISATVDTETRELFDKVKNGIETWDDDTFYVCLEELPEYSEGLYSYWIDGAFVYLPKPLENEYDNCVYMENAYEKVQELMSGIE